MCVCVWSFRRKYSKMWFLEMSLRKSSTFDNRSSCRFWSLIYVTFIILPTRCDRNCEKYRPFLVAHCVLFFKYENFIEWYCGKHPSILHSFQKMLWMDSIYITYYYIYNGRKEREISTLLLLLLFVIQSLMYEHFSVLCFLDVDWRWQVNFSISI